MAKKRHMRSYDEFLHERLKDPEHVLGYLNATLMDHDQRVFLQALKDVVHAQESDPSKPAQSGLNQKGLLKMLSDKDDPRFSSLRTVLDTLNVGISLYSTKESIDT